jgi:hypothetical protein
MIISISMREQQRQGEFLMNMRQNMLREDEIEYEPKKIIDEIVVIGGKREYKVKWKGYSETTSCWELASSLKGIRVIRYYFDM